MTTLIKCCGMFRSEDIEAVNEARPDYCGFIVNFPRSHRSVSPEQASKLRVQLEGSIAAVGVFVDESEERVADIATECSFDVIQLHGGEDEEYIKNLRSLTNKPIIKAFTIRTLVDLDLAKTSSADYVLLDNGQGTGETFNWQLLEKFDRPYFLAGGLTPTSIPQAIERLHPYAIDISSGIETNKAKDPEKIASAVKAARGSWISV